jgi:hypothetical protein
MAFGEDGAFPQLLIDNIAISILSPIHIRPTSLF